jgi:molybdopterin-guanine dinucleotide biosynthesis protein B
VKVLGIAGWSGSGKTTLITALIPCLQARGVRVSSIKHAHHLTALDQPGKDSFRHAEAGAEEVILSGISGFALFGRPVSLAGLLARLAPVDLVLVEGLKDAAIPKLEVHRPSLGRPPLWPEHTMLAVASGAALPDCPVPVLPLDAPQQITHFLMTALGLDGAPT